MDPRVFRLRAPFLVVAVLVGGGAAPDGSSVDSAGAPSTDPYLEATAAYFGVPLGEVEVLADWGLPVDEVSVVLFLAQRSGVSPDALIALRRGGTPWMQLARRYGLDAGAFHVAMAPDEAGALLGRARERFQEAPQAEWATFDLSDEELVALVNVRVLSRQLGASAGRVLEARESEGSFHSAYRAIAGGGGSR